MMKKAALILGIFLIGFTAQAQEETVTVKVTIENVLNDNGTILASLHSNDTFMKGTGIIDLVDKAKKGSVTMTFEDVKPGTYAIMVLHDENDNMRMDFDADGRPKESYGMSGNAMVMGPPTFNDAKFEVTKEDLEFNIRF
ncbi:DUF2141 domain-containing protein [Croceitalea rosinachiae]|uniref:DUF2141 domain-containing protein n=1 Tax=Croceitalea rosinachiae TaxID=3075596 RepID=A0ABU3AA76_9FLAO|nr:DUF2141 domain-containing protein [Croceitalea sp. F388]MDT0607088.1 DUF2141 domain-containing protein [Croceitalea sp. F388]